MADKALLEKMEELRSFVIVYYSWSAAKAAAQKLKKELQKLFHNPIELLQYPDNNKVDEDALAIIVVTHTTGAGNFFTFDGIFPKLWTSNSDDCQHIYASDCGCIKERPSNVLITALKGTKFCDYVAEKYMVVEYTKCWRWYNFSQVIEAINEHSLYLN